MTSLAASGFIDIGADRLAYRHWGPHPSEAPTLVLLHEGLGSADLWADLPTRLQKATGLGVLAYSRRGYGASSPRALPWPYAYMHEEAREFLPRLLDGIGLRRGCLIGASDGASIATVFAGTFNDHRVKGLTLIAPHFIVEEATAAGARAAKQAFEHGDLRPKLARWHQNVEIAFYGWNATWVEPRFKAEWDITEHLPRIGVPIQILQGERDEYGTEEQLNLARRLCTCPVEATLMPDVGHSIFREAPEETATAITAFVQRVLA